MGNILSGSKLAAPRSLLPTPCSSLPAPCSVLDRPPVKNRPLGLISLVHHHRTQAVHANYFRSFSHCRSNSTAEPRRTPAESMRHTALYYPTVKHRQEVTRNLCSDERFPKNTLGWQIPGATGDYFHFCQLQLPHLRFLRDSQQHRRRRSKCRSNRREQEATEETEGGRKMSAFSLRLLRFLRFMVFFRPVAGARTGSRVTWTPNCPVSLDPQVPGASPPRRGGGEAPRHRGRCSPGSPPPGRTTGGLPAFDPSASAPWR